jgi:hypothetical protein
MPKQSGSFFYGPPFENFNTHTWRQTTRKGKYCYWTCTGCGTKLVRGDALGLPPNVNNVEQDIRDMSCMDVMVKKIMEA